MARPDRRAHLSAAIGRRPIEETLDCRVVPRDALALAARSVLGE